MSPDPRHRPQSSRAQHQCPGRARQYRASRVFLAGDSARIINPPTGELGGNTAESRTPTTWPGSCDSSAPRPGWSRPLLDTYHNVNGTRSDCSLYAAEAFARFGSRVGQGAEVPHSSNMGR
jgi:hypothetical protein